MVEKSIGRAVSRSLGGPTENTLGQASAPTPTVLIGLSGDLALQAMGRRAKKRALEEKKKEEEEAKQLKERIIKAN